MKSVEYWSKMAMDRLDRSKIKNENDLRKTLNELNVKLQTEEERNKLRNDELLNLYIQFEKATNLNALKKIWNIFYGINNWLLLLIKP